MRKVFLCSDPEVARRVSDPHRMRLLGLLMRRPATLTQLAQAVGQSPAWVRHHLSVLVEAGVVELSEVRKRGRVTEKYYRACSEGLLFQHWVLPAVSQPVVIFAGSHDLALEQLAEALEPHLLLLAMPQGSLNGLVALRQGLCHLAGAHLHEPGGDFNLPTLRHLFPDRTVGVVTLAYRIQGLMVAPGNPLGLRDLSDLARPGLRWVGRNPGSGTHLWMQQTVRRLGLALPAPRQVVSTHTEAAALVAQGQADVAVGLEAAAARFGLVFIPLFAERYDLVFGMEQRERLAPLLDFLQSAAYRRRVRALPGYDPAQSGTLLSLEE
ncbi:substrate-binding domain-containing protein [Thermanaerothrix daxensis]|uniref:substrate-binding domain-containing protein n=1 Tax=Thermanaerothrix daxensis TaxID=869279 RepID=UPI0006C908E8|nr:substrate-binding domain-containing protein [Thermanaerothrix daxensis]